MRKYKLTEYIYIYIYIYNINTLSSNVEKCTYLSDILHEGIYEKVLFKILDIFVSINKIYFK